MLFSGYRASVWDERVMYMDGGDECTAVCRYLMPLNCTLKNHSKGNFHIVMLFHNKKYVNTYTEIDKARMAKILISVDSK